MLVWDRDRIAAGEVWRILSGQLVHGSVEHALINIAAGVLILVLPDGRASYGQWATALLVTGLSVGLGLSWAPWPDVYSGLSGALHGLLAWLVCRCASRERAGWLLVGLLLAVKIAAEQIFGSDLGTRAAIGVPVAIDAHLFGASAGVVVGLLTRGQARAPAPARE